MKEKKLFSEITMLDRTIDYPAPTAVCPHGSPVCKQRLGGLLKHYARAA